MIAIIRIGFLIIADVPLMVQPPSIGFA
jgi:hypothetical protein